MIYVVWLSIIIAVGLLMIVVPMVRWQMERDRRIAAEWFAQRERDAQFRMMDIREL